MERQYFIGWMYLKEHTKGKFYYFPYPSNAYFMEYVFAHFIDIDKGQFIFSCDTYGFRLISKK